MAKAKHTPRVFVPVLSVNPTQVNYFYRDIDGFKPSKSHNANAFHLDDNAHNGFMSAKARKRIECALSWLLYMAKPKWAVSARTGKKFLFTINFVTLTLPAVQVHSDQEITKRCLGNLLDILSKKLQLKNYLWRAEAQANGNIHFHLTTDIYIPHADLRKWWNQSLELLGYVSSFELKHKHRNPNSVDVHSVKHVRRLSSYLSKYMAKNRSFPCIGELRLVNGKQIEILYGTDKYRNEQANKKEGKVIGHILGSRIRPITSRLWFCSRSLSAKKSFIVTGEDYRFEDVASLIKKCEFRRYDGEFVTSLYGNFAPVVDSLSRELVSM